MDNKFYQKEEEITFFESYNDKVCVIGFKPSWISEIKDDMKDIYENGRLDNNSDLSSAKK